MKLPTKEELKNQAEILRVRIADLKNTETTARTQREKLERQREIIQIMEQNGIHEEGEL